MMLRGIPVSEGIGIGKVYVVRNQEISYEKKKLKTAAQKSCVFTMQLMNSAEKIQPLQRKWKTEWILMR